MNSEKCKSAALRYVAMQAKTEGQVEDYLKRKGFEKESIEEALVFLREYDYINDEKFCRMYFREAAIKGKGRRRIEQELIKKKISPAFARTALNEMLSDDNPEYDILMEEILPEKERALKLGRKMLRIHLEDGKEADKNFMAKVGRRLISQGYGQDVLYSVIGTLMKESKKCKDDTDDDTDE